MRIKSIALIILRITDVLALCFLVPLFVCSLFKYRTIDFETIRETTFEAYANPVVSLLLAFFIVIALLVPIRLIERMEDQRTWRLAYAVMGLCVTVIVIIGHWWIMANPFEPVADQEQVWRAAVDVAYGKGPVNTDLIYFQEYPQQKPMVVFMSLAARLFSADIIAYEHMNLFFIAAAVFMMALCVKEASNRAGIVILTSILLTSFVPLLLYSKFIYGSVPAIFFSICSGYGLLRGFREKSAFWILFPVIFTPFAVMLYQSELIFFIAVVIVIVVGGIIVYQGKQGVLVCAAAVCSMVLLTMLMSMGSECVFERSLGVAEEGGDGIPPSGHMLMGIMDVDDNMPGNYNGESQRIYEELGYDTKAADIRSRQKILDALNDFIAGERSLKFFLIKTECQWLDPWFGGLTMNVYDAEYIGSYDNEKWDSFLFGTIPRALQGYLRIIMIIIYGGAICCIVYRLLIDREVNPVVYLPSIYFIGGFIFQFLWEQKSRYCLPYYIALFPLAAYGIFYSSYRCSSVANGMGKREILYVLVGMTGGISLILAASISTAHDFNSNVYKGKGIDLYQTKDMQLPKGDYGIVLQYKTDEDIELMLYLDRGGTGYPVSLSRAETECEIPAYMNGYKDAVHFELDESSTEKLTLYKIHVYSAGIFYLDYLYLTLIFIIGVGIVYRIFKPSSITMRKPAENQYISIIIALVLLTLPVSIIVGRWNHIPILCRLFRISAWFSVFVVLLSLYILAAYTIYKSIYIRNSNDDKP